MAPFFINGILATENNFNKLQKIFEKLDPASKKFFVDNQLTEEEIDHFLDIDQDGRFRLKDLSQGFFKNSFQSFQIIKILNAHSYYLYNHLFDKSNLLAAFGDKEVRGDDNFAPIAYKIVDRKLEEISELELQVGNWRGSKEIWDLNEQNFPLPLRKEPSFILKLLALSPSGSDDLAKAIWPLVDLELKQRFEFVFEALLLHPVLFLELDEKFKNDKFLISSILVINLDLFNFLSEKIKQDKEIFEIAKKTACVLANDSRKLPNGKTVGLRNYLCFPVELQNNPELFLPFFKKNPEIFYSSKLKPLLVRKDLSLKIIEAIAEESSLIFNFRPELIKNKSIVLQALKRHREEMLPLVLSQSHYKNDREVVLEVLKICRNIGCLALLESQGSLLVKEKDIVRVAIENADPKSDALAGVKYFQTNEEMVSLALSVAPLSLKSVSPVVLPKIRDKVLKVISTNGLLLEFAGIYKNDPEVVFTAIKQNPAAFQFADLNLRENLELIRYAMKRDIRILRDIGPDAQKNIKLFEEAIEINASALTYASTPVTVNKNIVLKAVKKIGALLEYVHETLKKDPEVVSAALQSDSKAIKFASHSTFTDPKVYQLLIRQEGFGHFPELANSFLWKEKIALLEKKGIYFPEDMTHDYLHFREGLEKLNIDFPQRFQRISTLAEIVQNRLNPFSVKDQRPLVVLFSPKTDWNHAFEAHLWWHKFIPSMVDIMVDYKKFRVLYFENGRDIESQKILEDISANQKKIKGLVWVGHGTQKVLALGGEDLRSYKTIDERNEAAKKAEEFYIDIWDFEEGQFNILGKIMDVNSWIINDSCSNGKGNYKGYNLANSIHQVAPKSYIFTAEKPSNLRRFSFDENGLPQIDYWGSSAYNIPPTIK